MEDNQPAPNAEPGTSLDGLLGGRIRLLQPESGYRVAIDPVLLAAAVPAADGDNILDVGSGVGAAALCLAVRLPGARLTGIERDRESLRLAARNAEANHMAARVHFILGDLRQLPARLAPAGFDHAMANPPFGDPARGHHAPRADKRAATVEDVPFRDWVRFAALMVRHKGTVTVIHRADRLADVLAAMGEFLGDLVVFPLWPGGARGGSAKRVIVRGRKGVASPLRLVGGLTLHAADGGYTPETLAILRDAGALAID